MRKSQKKQQTAQKTNKIFSIGFNRVQTMFNLYKKLENGSKREANGTPKIKKYLKNLRWII